MTRILLAENDGILRQLLHQVLYEAGYNVVAVANGFKRLRAINAQRFDVLVTDIVMPDMDGLELIRHARRSFPAMRIVAITGGVYRLEPDLLLRAASAAGADITLRKPIPIHELTSMVARLTQNPMEMRACV
jgi:two-component system cell cycle response regulator CpdR